MAEKSAGILTPQLLWQDFDWTLENLSFSIISSAAIDGIVFTDLYFTAYPAKKDAPVRVFMKVAHKRGGANFAPLLYIPDYGAQPENDFLRSFAEDGYAVFAADYSGAILSAQNYTKYPESLSYGNLLRANDRLTSCVDGAENTSLFLWSRLMRQAITFILSYPGLTEGQQLVLAANSKGANIGWTVAGTDRRVSAFIPVMNAGWQESDAENALLRGETISPEREMWLSSIGVAAYAKRVKCPTLFVGASNSPVTPVEKIAVTLNAVPGGAPFVVAPRLNSQISGQALNTVRYFLKGLPSGEPLPAPPALSAEPPANKPFARVKADIKTGKIQSAYIAAASSAARPEFRNWAIAPLTLDENGHGGAQIPVTDNTAPALAFANVTYESGITFTTNIISVNVATAELVRQPNAHIVYARDMGVADFVADDSEGVFYMEDDGVFMANGALELSGVTVKRGNLSSYAIGGTKKSGSTALLHLGLYSKEARGVTLVFYVADGGKPALPYYCEFKLPEDEWTTVSLPPSSFRTANMVSLRSWDNVQKLSLKNAAGLLVGNIIWV